MPPPNPESNVAERLAAEDLLEAWNLLVPEDRLESFQALPRPEAEDLFLSLSARDQADLLLMFPQPERRSWIRLLAPDDAADLIQEIPPEEREEILALLDDTTRKEVNGLLAYAEDDAGGLMNPRYIRVRPDMTVDEAITYLRRQAADRAGAMYYAYVLDAEQKLRGVVSFRELLSARPDQRVEELMQTDLITVPEAMDQEELSRLFATYRFVSFPVVDAQGHMKGIVTLDDIVDVVREEATEDIQKIGGTAALDAPYLRMGIMDMIKKRAGWLAALFIGETLTATAMGYFEAEIARAVVLALFVPLVISSGGNSGSQATTLIIRAMALGEVRLRDWWRVVRREFFSGLGLGAILATIGIIRILVWQAFFHTYGEHHLLVALTVAASLVGVVLWGTLVGSMLPFLLRRLGFDPASASAPFVATLVDVTGLVIYFTTAKIVLSGTLL
ncbi:MAG: magnesium transporter [Candidatus Eisenbacteria bacterium]|uniref:Magnesium transporter MgtE n=1 Tax=Eiseniibacteriota bacterium TaxID=2212470 RepID=A0A538SSM1_UNCEI|nr:MAG: magnesium transporter [Candidatus Eisenbacteria bacterium]